MTMKPELFTILWRWKCGHSS